MSDRSAPPNETDYEKFRKRLIDNIWHKLGQAIQLASFRDAQTTLALTVRDQLIERYRETVDAMFAANPKSVCYFSAEYLLGKQLPRNMLYTNTTEMAARAANEFELDFDQLLEMDSEPGLGNGGLGRLAACFLDSLATMNIPAIGYGIRYEFGIFKQTFEDGWQVEHPDEWLLYGNPWEFPQPDDMVEVGFGGHTEHIRNDAGRLVVQWIPSRKVMGEPYTMLVPGYGTKNVNILRLWRARATREFDFRLFDEGDYVRAVEQKILSENITKVLYPNDSTRKGRQLRLQQQYFFVACSLKDILRRFLLLNEDWSDLPEKIAMQLNDTHPVVAIPELMRLLMDEYGLGWERSWDLARRCFAYTCHTLLPEALERWPVDLFGELLPRHLEIVTEINHRFLAAVHSKFPDDDSRVQRMSIIDDASRQIRMANLATVGSYAINGVAELQSKLLRERTLRDFAELWPEKFQNKTNGVTPRRFMRLANPRLSELITSKLGDNWLTDLERLRELEPYLEDNDFCSKWMNVKQRNKLTLASKIKELTGAIVDPESIFDVMVKRLHEYKRQLLKTLHIITLFHRIKSDPSAEITPRTFIFGAKAAPGYFLAKRIIKLINNVAKIVNNDPDIAGRLQVVFLPNFNVSLAERVYPAADVSEQISLAGKEASGTGNMKFALNGAITVGTLDGANVEIRERVGAENFFLFGMTVDQVTQLKRTGYQPVDYYHANAELKNAIDSIDQGQFSNGDRELFRPILDSLFNYDEYLVLVDYPSYVQASERAATAYQDCEHWTRMSILNVARCGFFSSDRTIRQYCEEIWNVKPVPA
jgi:starch phosphorylase